MEERGPKEEDVVVCASEARSSVEEVRRAVLRRYKFLCCIGRVGLVDLFA